MKKKNILSYLLAFSIPILIFIFSFIILNVFFTSDKNFIISDMQAQYYPLLSYYQDLFTGKESIFYTFNSGLGNSMLSTFTYYLSSPLNLFILLFNKTNLHVGIILLMLIKIGLSSLTMYIYLNHKINYRKKFTLLFSVCYALMSYNICYCFNIMWLDGVILAPLILFGIDKLLDNKPLLFSITLFLAILSNYYIGYMICIFSSIYMIYSLFMKFNLKKDKKIIVKKFLEFVFIGILCALMTTFILLPGLIELRNSNKEIVNIFDNFKFIQNPLDIFSRTFIGIHNSENILNKTGVNIYSSLIILPLLFFYLVNKNISKKEKYGFVGILIILIISVCFSPLNIIWHGISFPQCFNYRYSFLFSLFFIYIAYKSFTNINSIKIKYFIYFLVLYITLSILTILFIDLNYENYFIYISIFITVLYLLLLYNMRKQDNDLMVLLVILVIVELSFNTYISFKDYSFNYNELYNKYTNQVNDYIDKYNSDEEFYRMEKTYSLTSNDSLLLSYKGVTHFLSTANGNVINFLVKSGLQGNNLNIDYSNYSTEIMDSLLGVKYIFTDDGELKYHNLIETISLENKVLLKKIDKKYVYENVNNLNFGYIVDKKILDYKNENLNSYEYQSYIMNLMLDNNDNYFNEQQLIYDDGYFLNEQLNYLYLYFKINKSDDENIIIKLNGNIFTSVTKLENILKIPYGKNYKISFSVVDKDNNELELKNEQVIIKAYKFNQTLFDDSVYELKKQQLNVEKINNNSLSGNINVLEDGILFTTIPYQKGWTIIVDGKKVSYQKLLDTFIGINLEKGKHNIKFEYKTPYLKEGIILSLGSFTLLIIYLIFKYKKIDNN